MILRESDITNHLPSVATFKTIMFLSLTPFIWWLMNIRSPAGDQSLTSPSMFLVEKYNIFLN